MAPIHIGHGKLIAIHALAARRVMPIPAAAHRDRDWRRVPLLVVI
jgi:hypothetical protein